MALLDMFFEVKKKDGDAPVPKKKVQSQPPVLGGYPATVTSTVDLATTKRKILESIDMDDDSYSRYTHLYTSMAAVPVEYRMVSVMAALNASGITKSHIADAIRKRKEGVAQEKREFDTAYNTAVKTKVTDVLNTVTSQKMRVDQLKKEIATLEFEISSAQSVAQGNEIELEESQRTFYASCEEILQQFDNEINDLNKQ